MTKEERWLLDEKYGGDASAEGFKTDKRRLARGEPVAYVIGWQPFLGLRIYLDSRPLIPRPETEWWTSQLMSKISGTHELRFLDLCAGSGAIGCVALAKIPQARVYFGEIDAAHKPTIQKSIELNGLDGARAEVGIGDLFEPFGTLRFDVIAANPPYIPSGRKLAVSVAQYEPGEALYAGADGLDLIRRILTELPEWLAPSGMAWIEIDSAQANAAQELASGAGLRGEIRTDQYGVPRLLVVSF